jgi:IS5 family transposase
MTLTTRHGPAAVAGLNEALLAKAAAAKLLRTTRLRADTTVVPGHRRRTAHPATGPVPLGWRASTRDHLEVALRTTAGRDEAQAVVRRVTGQLADLADIMVTDAQRLLGNARRALSRHGSRPHDCTRAVSTTRRQVGGGAAWPARSTTWPRCWPLPARSSRRPGSG